MASAKHGINQSMDKPYKCDFCKASFSKESTLMNHLCEKKRRWLNRDESHVNKGFHCWLKWYEITNTSPHQKIRTYQNFMESNVYNAFIKLGRLIEETKLVNPEQFLRYVIDHGIKIDNWTNNTTYERFVKDVCKREDVQTALERFVKLAESWASENDYEWYDFFVHVNPGVAYHYIRNGRLSPWVVFNAQTSDKMLDRMSEEQRNLIDQFIDSQYWIAKMKRNPKDTRWVQEILSKYGV